MVNQIIKNRMQKMQKKYRIMKYINVILMKWKDKKKARKHIKHTVVEKY